MKQYPDTTPSFPVKIRLAWISKVALWAGGLMLSGGLVYLQGMFASHVEVQTAVAPLATRIEVKAAVADAVDTLPTRGEMESTVKAAMEPMLRAVKNMDGISNRVSNLEEAKVQASTERAIMSQQLQSISNEQSSQGATLMSIVSSQNRILDRLDRLAEKK